MFSQKLINFSKYREIQLDGLKITIDKAKYILDNSFMQAILEGS